MIPKILTSVLLIFTCLCSAQKEIAIEIEYPQPRVGQSVTFSIHSDFLTDYIKKELGKKIEVQNETSMFTGRTNFFEKTIIFKKAKRYQIGPFEFDFNGKSYTTNALEIEVIPDLPFEEGLWLRHIEFEGKAFLVVEQLVQNIDNTRYNENGFETTVGGELPNAKEFASLKEDLTKGVKLYSIKSFQITKRREGAKLNELGMSYKYTTYQINYSNNVPVKYTVSEKDFLNLPKVHTIGNITLTN